MQFGDFESRQESDDVRQQQDDAFERALADALGAIKRDAEAIARDVSSTTEGDAESESEPRRSNMITVTKMEIPMMPEPTVPPSPPILPPVIPALQETGTAGDCSYPTDEGEYTYTVDGDGHGTWTVRKLPPDIPDAVAGQDNFYVLRRNSSGDPEWYLLDKVTIPDCSSGTTVYRDVFAKPPPGP